MEQSQYQNTLISHQQHNKQLWRYLQNLTNNSNQNKKTLLSPQPYSQQQKSHPKCLEQQLNFLSLSYKNSQQKLLQLQKQLYHQSLYNEKQRSMIQILKYIINENFDDETLLTYIADLNQSSADHSQASKKYQIKAELQEIKEIIIRRRSENKKMNSLKEGTITQLKKQLKKCNIIKKQLMEDLDCMFNEKQQLASEVNTMRKQLQTVKNQKNNISYKLQAIQQQFKQQKAANQDIKKQNTAIQQKLQQKQQQQAHLTKKIIKFMDSVSSKLTSIDKNHHKTEQISITQIIQKLCSKLVKYRNLTKQLNQRVISNQKWKQLTIVMRMFVPQQAEQILQKFEHGNNIERDCLIKQLSCLGRLHRKKLCQMQQCQQQMWSWKVRNLCDQQQYLQHQLASKSRSNSNSRTSPNTMQKHQLEQQQVLENAKQNWEPNVREGNRNWSKNNEDNKCIQQFSC